MQEWETAQTAYKRAEADGTVSRYNDGDDGLMMMMMGLSAGKRPIGLMCYFARL